MLCSLRPNSSLERTSTGKAPRWRRRPLSSNVGPHLRTASVNYSLHEVAQ